MDEHKHDRLNGTPPMETQQPQLFALRDAATGAVRAIRDMTDEELARHKVEALRELAQANSTMAQVMMQAAADSAQAVVRVKALIAVINYEAHRRQFSLILPPR
jgi:hypothetical protein